MFLVREVAFVGVIIILIIFVYLATRGVVLEGGGSGILVFGNASKGGRADGFPRTRESLIV